MTRQEWIDEIISWYDLVHFCVDEGYDGCVDDIYTDEERDESVNGDLVQMAREAGSWEDLYSMLDCIPTGYEYYKYFNGNWYGLDDYDFRERKSEVLEELDDSGFFNPYEEEEAPYEDDPDDLIQIEAEDIDMLELLDVCHSGLQKIEVDNNQKNDDQLEDLLVSVGVSVSV